METNITVTQAGPKDADAMGEIHAESWKASYVDFFPADLAARMVLRRRSQWHERLAEPDGVVMLAALDDRPLAMSWFGPSTAYPDMAEIHSLYAHPDGWGTGVANALMAAVLSHLQADGIRHVHLWTLRDTPQSRRFHTKSGFTESGATRDHDFGEGNVLAQVEYRIALPGVAHG